MSEVHFSTEAPYDFDGTLRMRRFGRVDPTCRLEPGRFLKAWNTPGGPVTVVLECEPSAPLSIRGELHGPGAAWMEPRLAPLLGLHELVPSAPPPAAPPWLARAWRENRGLRLSRTPVLSDEHVAYVLQQRVEYLSAIATYRALTERYSSPAPGEFGLLLPLTPKQWAHIPSHVYSEAGVDAQRYRHVQVAVRAARQVDATPHVEALRALLMSLPGTKSWTTESVLAMGHGDPDAVPLGDVHLPHQVVRAFLGRPSGSDEEMVRLLEPFRPQRARVIRLLLGQV